MTHHPPGPREEVENKTAEPAERPMSVPERRVGNRRLLDQRILTVVEGMSDAFLALGPDWRITYANREAARLNGTKPEALIGRDHWVQWPEARGSEVERQYRRAMTQRVPVAFEHHYPDARVWHDIRVYPSDDGGLAIFYRDITHEKALQQELEQHAAMLAQALDRSRDAEMQVRLLVDRVRDYAVFLMDPDGVITQWGEGAIRMKGYTREQAIGEHLSMLYPEGAVAEDGTPEEHLQIARERGEYIGEGTRRRANGELFPARLVLTALRRGGELVGFSKITQDLTNERRREQALARATAEAEAASIAKSQFLANTSHEIRTPLNAVMGYAELLEVGLAGALTEQQRHYVTRIQATSRHLLSLINDVLDLSKIEAGEMRTAREPGLVSEVVMSALQLVEPQAAAKRVSIGNACTAAVVAAYLGDVERVRQILVNLLSNAVRFTEAGGRITVSCGSSDHSPLEGAQHAGPWTFVRVQDTGIGIAPEQLPLIWEAFMQGDPSRTRKFGGTGLGLTISRYLARLMGGDITVSSAPGLGSTFVLWVPAADPREVRRATPPRPLPGGAEASSQALLALTPEGEPTELRELAEALLAETERVLAMYVARLRADPGTPSARAATDVQAEDHSVTFLADIAQCLQTVAEDGPGAAALLRDGSEIQRLIAHRHGAQRAALGWRESELRREYAILRDEVHAALARGLNRVNAAEVERARTIVDHFLTAAERASLEGFARP